ncbi:MAG: N-acetylneuraminate synthase family protein, partial [Planctomycetota bacterium]
AEIGQNHNGQIGMARRLIDMAADCGCDAVKFQKRDVEWELTRDAYNRPYTTENSFGETYGLHREFLELTEQQHRELRDYALSRGLIYFCTACDPPSVEAMDRIGNPLFKIASRDITNIPLLERIRATGKPVVISTGMASMDEIGDALRVFEGTSTGCLITHCVSQYPTDLENVNLRAMRSIAEQFSCEVGLSDHTTGIVTCVAAAALGASFIEKHVTLSRAMPGTDHAAALEKNELRQLVQDIRAVELAMGDGTKSFLPLVTAAKNKLSRSLTSKTFIPAGTLLSEEHLILKSPGVGISWKRRDEILGCRVQSDIPKDTTLTRQMFELC